MSSPESVRARRVEVTDEIRDLDTLAEPDYASAFKVTIICGDRRSPEQWARALFEGAPQAVKAFVVTGWIAGLGMRLGPRPSTDHVLGWKIETTTSDVIILSVHSAVVGTAHLALRVEESHVVLASFLRYERRLAPIVWSLVVPLHHRILQYLLGNAAAHPHSA